MTFPITLVVFMAVVIVGIDEAGAEVVEVLLDELLMPVDTMETWGDSGS